MFSLIERGVGLLVGLAALLGGVALVVITAVVCIDVAGRYFGSPLFGARDIVQVAAVFAVFGGMAYLDRRDGHIQVDVLQGVFPAALNRVLTIVGYAVGAVAFGLIAWQMWVAAGYSVMLNSATNLLRIPEAPFQIALAVLSAIAVLQMLLRIVQILTGRKDGK
ncbi:TRAP transporter small permease [Fulvimarina sp. MAC8]|uniref:TRAP transporter small permease n=1 Tax=Fulvimarina sp. MAC8 TaxID=3162874 RepID=UPI0032F02CF2